MGRCDPVVMNAGSRPAPAATLTGSEGNSARSSLQHSRPVRSSRLPAGRAVSHVPALPLLTGKMTVVLGIRFVPGIVRGCVPVMGDLAALVPWADLRRAARMSVPGMARLQFRDVLMYVPAAIGVLDRFRLRSAIRFLIGVRPASGTVAGIISVTG